MNEEDFFEGALVLEKLAQIDKVDADTIAIVLKIVLLINVLMFGVQLTSGTLSRSTALIADSLEMFGNASTYALTLHVLNMSESLAVLGRKPS